MKIDYEEYNEKPEFFDREMVLCKCCEFYYDHEDSSDELNLCKECSEIEDIEPEEDKDYWNLLPDDIKLKIFHINKEAERREWKVNIYPHLDGRIKIIKSPSVKTYYWINCVSCGCDTSHRRAKTYHWCERCYDKYGRRWKESEKHYKRRMERLVKRGDMTPLKTSRPLLIGRDKCPFILNDQLVLKPAKFTDEYAILNTPHEFCITDDD